MAAFLANRKIVANRRHYGPANCSSCQIYCQNKLNLEVILLVTQHITVVLFFSGIFAKKFLSGFMTTAVKIWFSGQIQWLENLLHCLG